MTNYTVTAPLVVIPNADGTSGDGYFYKDAVVPSGWNDDRCKVLAGEGMLAKGAAETGGSSEAPTTAKAILAEVGDDKEKAQAALDAENAKSEPRKGLVADLQKVIEA